MQFAKQTVVVIAKIHNYFPTLDKNILNLSLYHKIVNLSNVGGDFNRPPKRYDYNSYLAYFNNIKEIKNMTLDDILIEIKKVKNICILAHENPDGDAIGSSLGLCDVLKNMNKHVEVLMKKVPENFSFMPGFEDIKEESEIEKFDMAIVVDCPDIKRVNNDLIKYFEKAEVKVEFDHHMNNTMFADYNVVNHVTPACTQILVESLDYLEIEISKNAMTNFLTGIITDTGGFKNSGVTVETFEIAGRALEMGINLPKIYKKSMLEVSKNRFEIRKLAMERMEFFCEDKISFTYITKEDEENLHLKSGDHEGIVELGRNIQNVEVSIFLREEEKGYKISLRSNDYVNVAEICMLFGGGGHMRAAGANTLLSLEEAKKALVKEIEKRLK